MNPSTADQGPLNLRAEGIESEFSHEETRRESSSPKGDGSGSDLGKGKKMFIIYCGY